MESWGWTEATIAALSTAVIGLIGALTTLVIKLRRSTVEVTAKQVTINTKEARERQRLDQDGEDWNLAKAHEAYDRAMTRQEAQDRKIASLENRERRCVIAYVSLKTYCAGLKSQIRELQAKLGVEPTEIPDPIDERLIDEGFIKVRPDSDEAAPAPKESRHNAP